MSPVAANAAHLGQLEVSTVMPDEFADPIARLSVLLSCFVHRCLDYVLPQRKVLTTHLCLKEEHLLAFEQ